jgi:hypothetical protein
MLRRLRRRLRHPIPEIVVVACLAAYVEIGLRRWTLPELSRRLHVRMDLSSDAGPVPEQIVLPSGAKGSIRAVNRVLTRWPWGDTCLRRALLLGHRLSWLDPTLRIGVRRAGDGRIGAHAWLEIGGHSIDPEAAEFVAFGAA